MHISLDRQWRWTDTWLRDTTNRVTRRLLNCGLPMNLIHLQAISAISSESKYSLLVQSLIESPGDLMKDDNGSDIAWALKVISCFVNGFILCLKNTGLHIMYYNNYNSQTSLFLLTFDENDCFVVLCATCWWQLSFLSVSVLFCLWQTTLAVRQDLIICKIYHIGCNCNCITCTVSQKHVTTLSTISWTRIVRLQQFLAHLLPRL